MVHHLIRSLEAAGEDAAATLVARLGAKAEVAREVGKARAEQGALFERSEP